MLLKSRRSAKLEMPVCLNTLSLMIQTKSYLSDVSRKFRTNRPLTSNKKCTLPFKLWVVIVVGKIVLNTQLYRLMAIIIRSYRIR